jgi:hypothetical protein
MRVERRITVDYLAKIAGVKKDTVWRDVRELLSIIEEEPLPTEEAST